jgi:hypothetical protein
MRHFVIITVLSALGLIGCGGAKAGEACDQAGFLCETATAALECRVGKWTSLPCRGPGGCTRSGDTIKCDMSGNSENDPCASTAEGKGLCTANGTATLECRQGTLVKTNTCSTCTVSGDQVVCTQ